LVPEIEHHFTILEVDSIQGVDKSITPNLLPLLAFQFIRSTMCN